MTMFSADDDHRRRFCGGYGGGGGAYAYAFSTTLGSDLLFGMAEDDLRNEGAAEAEDAEEEHESSSKVADDERERERETERERERDQEWLQLSIGGYTHQLNQDLQASTKNNNGRSSSSSGLVELDLMPTTTHSQIRQEFRPPRPPLANFGGFPPSFFLQNHGTATSNFPQPHEINWAFRPFPISIAAAAVPSSSSSSASYFPRPFQLYAGADMESPPPGTAATADFRVIQPPRRPHSGVWFMLQASQNQEKHPFLPQISKSYLRIKDGRMTVRLVIKYLVNKLSLEDESEIEIRCKGQRLLPFLTLQHVRDNIWSSPRDFITLLPNSSTTHHIMVLHYARTDPPN